MSSRVESSKDFDNFDLHQSESGIPRMKKSKKKKKLGLFSFRSKKTKTINNNTVTTDGTDSLSLCSEISMTEDGSYSSLTTSSSEKHTSVLESFEQSSKIQQHEEYLQDNASILIKGSIEQQRNTLTTSEEIVLSSDTIVDECNIATMLNEDDTAKPVCLSKHEKGHSAPDGRMHDEDHSKHNDKSQNVKSVCDHEKLADSPKRPGSIHISQGTASTKSGGIIALTKSLSKQKQKVFAEQQYSSSTDCSSYPVSPARASQRLKSKKGKMLHAVGATHQLTARLLSGQNLAARDSNGLSDPYVKFKIGGRTVHKSRTCKATLNPKWEHEQFTVPVKLSDEIVVRVFDRDIGVRDDFMGTSSFRLDSLIESEETELSLDLEDEDVSDEELGRIHVAVIVVPTDDIVDGSQDFDSRFTPDEFGDTVSVASLKVTSLSRSDSNASEISRRTFASESKSRKMKVPLGSATVQLISGKGLPPRDSNGLSDPYVKFQMGKQRQKSKVCYKTLDPVWKEEFVFHLTGRESMDRDPAMLDITVWDKDSYRKDDFIGRCELDLGSLEYDKTHELTLSLTDAPGTLLLLISLHSCLPSDNLQVQNNFARLKDKYSLTSTFSSLSDVGFAEVKIIRATGCRAADIGGKSDPFCVVELCNARAQTHTCYKTLDPVWNKTTFFPIKDIHDTLNFTVYDEDKNENDFLGRLQIPLLRVVNGVERTYALKDRKLSGRAKGTLTVQITFIYNQARAAIRTFSPREEKHMVQDPRFKRHVLLRNFRRVWACLEAVLQVLEFVNSCFTWQNPVRSATAFIVYLLLIWNVELYMLPILLLLLLMKNYFQVVVQQTKVDRRLSINPEESFDDDEDIDTEDSNNKVSLIQRLKTVEEVLLKVQNILDWIACLLERIHNTFTWSVPFLSTLAVIVLSVVVLILYFVPLRTIAVLWGINKFTKRLRKPNYIPNNEFLDFLSRIPSEVELDDFQELPLLQNSPRTLKKKR